MGVADCQTRWIQATVSSGVPVRPTLPAARSVRIRAHHTAALLTRDRLGGSVQLQHALRVSLSAMLELHEARIGWVAFSLAENCGKITRRTANKPNKH